MSEVLGVEFKARNLLYEGVLMLLMLPVEGRFDAKTELEQSQVPSCNAACRSVLPGRPTDLHKHQCKMRITDAVWRNGLGMVMKRLHEF